MHIFCDWNKNIHNPKGRIILFLFRVSNIAHRSRLLFLLFLPYLILYRLVVEWILCVEIPYKTIIGQGLTLYHGHSLVINDGAVIGSNCTIRHCTTIGNKLLQDGTYSRSPIIANNVDIGSNVCIIGPITIGSNVTIGCGSIVVKDIPDNSIVAGNPARVIKSFGID